MQLSPIGYFTKTHGVKGELILRTDADFELDSLKAVFCDSATGKQPYFIAGIKESAQSLVVSLEEIPTVEQAKKLVGKMVYIDSNLVIADEGEEDWLGYELVDKTHGSLGKVVAVSHNGFQDLISLQYKGREVILPVVEEFIEELNEEDKTILYNAPEGLIDLYLRDDTSEEEE